MTINKLEDRITNEEDEKSTGESTGTWKWMIVIAYGVANVSCN